MRHWVKRCSNAYTCLSQLTFLNWWVFQPSPRIFAPTCQPRKRRRFLFWSQDLWEKKINISKEGDIFLFMNRSPGSHYSDVTWASWRLKSLATRLSTQQLVTANFPSQRSSTLLIHDVIMPYLVITVNVVSEGYKSHMIFPSYRWLSARLQ